MLVRPWHVGIARDCATSILWIRVCRLDGRTYVYSRDAGVIPYTSEVPSVMAKDIYLEHEAAMLFLQLVSSSVGRGSPRNVRSLKQHVDRTELVKIQQREIYTAPRRAT